MSNIMRWVGDNLSLGGLVRHSTSALGTAANYTLQGLGAATSHLIEDPIKKERVRHSISAAGKAIDSGLTEGGKVMGTGVNTAVQFTGEIVGKASGATAKLLGASDNTAATVCKFGTVLGAAGVGMVAGAGIANAAVSLAAASGTAGAAATTSGLAALGGGSVAVGGGGMAVGQAVVQGIVGAGTVSGAATLKAATKGPRPSRP